MSRRSISSRIGTNDLVQYALAVDRGNKDVAGLYNSCDPAVLRLIDMTIKAAKRRGISCQFVRPHEQQHHLHAVAAGHGPAAIQRAPERRAGSQAHHPRHHASAVRSHRQGVMAMENAREIKMLLREEREKIAPELELR